MRGYNIDHASILNNSWSNEDAFRKAIYSAGIPFNDKLVADGQIHRFATGKKGQKDRWYVFYGMAGAFGDWSRNINEKWSINNDHLSD